MSSCLVILKEQSSLNNLKEKNADNTLWTILKFGIKFTGSLTFIETQNAGEKKEAVRRNIERTKH